MERINNMIGTIFEARYVATICDDKLMSTDALFCNTDSDNNAIQDVTYFIFGAHDSMKEEYDIFKAVKPIPEFSSDYQSILGFITVNDSYLEVTQSEDGSAYVYLPAFSDIGRVVRPILFEAPREQNYMCEESFIDTVRNTFKIHEYTAIIVNTIYYNDYMLTFAAYSISSDEEGARFLVDIHKACMIFNAAFDATHSADKLLLTTSGYKVDTRTDLLKKLILEYGYRDLTSVITFDTLFWTYTDFLIYMVTAGDLKHSNKLHRCTLLAYLWSPISDKSVLQVGVCSNCLKIFNSHVMLIAGQVYGLCNKLIGNHLALNRPPVETSDVNKLSNLVSPDERMILLTHNIVTWSDVEYLFKACDSDTYTTRDDQGDPITIIVLDVLLSYTRDARYIDILRRLREHAQSS